MFVSYLLSSSVRPGIVRVFLKFKCLVSDVYILDPDTGDDIPLNWL